MRTTRLVRLHAVVLQIVSHMWQPNKQLAAGPWPPACAHRMLGHVLMCRLARTRDPQFLDALQSRRRQHAHQEPSTAAACMAQFPATSDARACQGDAQLGAMD